MDPDELIENPNGGFMTPEQIEEMVESEGLDDYWPEPDEDDVADIMGEVREAQAWHEQGISPDEHLDRDFEDRISGYDHEQGAE